MNQIDIKCKKNAEISSALSDPKLSDWSIKAGITQAQNKASDLSAKKSPALKRLAAFFSIILAFSSFSPCLSSCSFMDSQWGSEESSSGSEKKNNGADAYRESGTKGPLQGIPGRDPGQYEVPAGQHPVCGGSF